MAQVTLVVCTLHVHIDLITTVGGERVCPAYIEEKIKAEIPILSNVMVIGDNREYLVCLVTLKVRACMFYLRECFYHIAIC